jgi:hypothetical protein
MKRAAATVIAISAFAAPAPALAGSALAGPVLAGPLPAARSAQAGTTTTPTGTTPTPTTTVPTKPVKLTLNNLSDRRALNAYATFLTSMINQEGVGQSNDAGYVTTISQPGTGGCKAALSKLTQPPYQVDTKAQHTLTVLGEEIGDDVTINFDLSATEAFTRFSGVLEPLRWTRLSGAGPVIRRYINAQTNMLAFAPSNLCLDASDAALHPDEVPDGTKAFLPLYNQASYRANLGLMNLLTMMQTYEIPSEKSLVARISVLASQLATQTKADLLQSGTALTTVLESN